MPIYEYKCEECGAEFEEWQKFSDPPVDTCPTCGGKASRLISRSTFILKGTGWYVTDYGRKDQGASPNSSKENSKGDSKKAESTSSTSETSSGSSGSEKAPSKAAASADK
jgi:putative FmdB family regulatory protein